MFFFRPARAEDKAEDAAFNLVSSTYIERLIDESVEGALGMNRQMGFLINEIITKEVSY